MVIYPYLADPYILFKQMIENRTFNRVLDKKHNPQAQSSFSK
jgi:hypothetical protein